jgi:HEAT repeat protein
MERVKNWVNQRKGVAVTLAQCAALPPDENAAATAKTEGKKKGAATTAETPKTTGYNTGPIVSSIFEFLIETALHDEDEDVYSEFVETGSTLVTLQGKHLAASLFSLFSAFLDRPRPTQPSRDSQVRESVAIFVGSLAQHLPAGDKQIVDVTEKLVEVLNTPSEPVRRSVAEILVKLGELLPPKESERILQKCFNNAMKAGKPGERRGAAFGFAGLTKSLGIAQVMQTLGYFEVLKKNTADADSAATDRHGSLCVFDALSRMFGRLFEPYLVHILSPLLSGFGDKNNQIREATVQAAKTIMGQLSGHCLKLVLPALLKALTDKQWRTKIGSIQLLGSMANCQPKQLSSCLPTIVPELFTVLSDTHQKVQQSAREALKAIGKVIQNPEIRMHVPVLLEALDDPAKYSSRALEALMKTHFVHHIDPASLSLIMPILHRALNDRNTDIKVKAATIVGNMCRLTEQKDLLPYLGGLMENIQIVLLDPIPSTRAIASKAVGSLVNGMGEEEFPKLIPWLLETIQNHAGFIERSGAAQGLSAVIAGLPDARFKNDLLPILLKGTLSEKVHFLASFFRLTLKGICAPRLRFGIPVPS